MYGEFINRFLARVSGSDALGRRGKLIYYTLACAVQGICRRTYVLAQAEETKAHREGEEVEPVVFGVVEAEEPRAL